MACDSVFFFPLQKYTIFLRKRGTKYLQDRPLQLLARVFPSLLVAPGNLPQKKLYFTVLDYILGDNFIRVICVEKSCELSRFLESTNTISGSSRFVSRLECLEQREGEAELASPQVRLMCPSASGLCRRLGALCTC